MSATNPITAVNNLLRTLSRLECSRLSDACKPVELIYGHILCEPGERIKDVYFPNSAIISLLTPLTGYPSVEVGLVGNDGLAGIALLLGITISPVRMLVQGSGSALQMKASVFRKESQSSRAFNTKLNRYLYKLMAQVTQTTACNCFHTLSMRLARWLLLMHDRKQMDEFYITQEFLSQMLGVQRAGVSKAASALQKTGLIRYNRGNITILDRNGLEAASCDCYSAVNALCSRAMSGASRH